MDVTDRAFKMYLQGWTLRKLEKYFNIPKSTLSDRFIRRYGENHRYLRNHVPIVKEYLKNPNIRAEDKEKIKAWLGGDGLFNILCSDSNLKPRKLYTSSQIETLTRVECGHESLDWRRLFEVVKFRNTGDVYANL